MIPATVAMLLFAFSSVAAKRSVNLLGAATASVLRILFAATLCEVYAHVWGAGLRGSALGWFIASGFIGYGSCDTAIFLALARLGAQLTSLMVRCLGAPIAAFTGWLWLGTPLGVAEIGAGLLILTGGAVAPFPRKPAAPAQAGISSPGPWMLGLGVIAAAGQTWGAELSRHGQLLSRDAGQPIDGLSVTYWRILAGVAFSVAWWLRQRSQGTVRKAGYEPPNLRRAWPWVVLNALSGPSLGVACYQWALEQQKTGGIMAIAALTPGDSVRLVVGRRTPLGPLILRRADGRRGHDLADLPVIPAADVATENLRLGDNLSSQTAPNRFKLLLFSVREPTDETFAEP
jgi:drug/metabolite transporter (DMT)-like permease